MHLVITASPNADGLTAACGKSAYEGILSAGGAAKIADISAIGLESCRICEDGWGTCRSAAKCVIQDGFAELQAEIRAAKGLVLVTPVYWGQPSERMQYFLCRFRRCESLFREDGAAKGKPVDLIAAAGGSGNGTAPCLLEMESWCRHVGAIPRERIGVTRFNRAPMLTAIRDAGARLAQMES